MLCMLYCSLVGFYKPDLQEEEVVLLILFVEVEGVSANCAEGKQQHDCPGVSPDVEALSWLSVPCPSLVSLCVS